jgi:hypothetical protein
MGIKPRGRKARPITDVKSTALGKKMMVVQLEWLTTYQGAARDERLYEGNSGSSWRVTTVETEPRGRKARPITDFTGTALGKEGMAVRL